MEFLRCIFQIAVAFSLASAMAFGAPSTQVSKRAEFLPILQRFQDLYGPQVAAQGGALVIDENLQDTGVVASADRRGTQWIIGIAGGVYTAPRMTEDAFRFTICHEFGHLFGGAPRRNVPPESDFPTDIDGKSLMTSEG